MRMEGQKGEGGNNQDTRLLEHQAGIWLRKARARVLSLQCCKLKEEVTGLGKNGMWGVKESEDGDCHPSGDVMQAIGDVGQAGFSVGGVWCGRGLDGKSCLDTPTHNGACILLGEGRAAPSPASCPGRLGSQAARETGASLTLGCPPLVALSASPRRRGSNWRPVHCRAREEGQAAHPHHPRPLAPLANTNGGCFSNGGTSLGSPPWPDSSLASRRLVIPLPPPPPTPKVATGCNGASRSTQRP